MDVTTGNELNEFLPTEKARKGTWQMKGPRLSSSAWPRRISLFESDLHLRLFLCRVGRRGGNLIKRDMWPVWQVENRQKHSEKSDPL